VTVRETVRAPKAKFHREDLDALFAGASRVLVGRGKSHVELDPRRDGMDAIAEKALGRSGSLRAPAARVGRTWLVGFTEEMWGAVL